MIAMSITVRGTCQTCGRRRRIRRTDGRIRNHYMWEPIDARSMDTYGYGPLCKGSNQPPREQGEQSWFCNTGCTGCEDSITYGV